MKLDKITKSAILKAAKYLNTHPVKTTSVYWVEVENNLHPFKELIRKANELAGSPCDLKSFQSHIEYRNFVENKFGFPVRKKKLARICWNDFSWTKPSGKKNKSINKESYEYLYGYGHEEWLLDFTKVINGYHYSYIQAIGDSHLGDTFDLTLYTINGRTKERFIVCEIRDVQVIDDKKDIIKEYTRNGWYKEMKSQLKDVDSKFQKIKYEEFDFNIRFKPEDCYILESQELLDKINIKADYYSTLYNLSPQFFNYRKFEFRSGHNPQKRQFTCNYEPRERDFHKIHAELQDICYKSLAKEYGKGYVGTENRTVNNTAVDIVVQTKDGYQLYEIKATPDIRICIRQALAQLLEYAHYGENLKISQMVIVSQNRINETAQIYLEHIRATYNLPVYYQRVNRDTKKLEKQMY